MNHTDRIIKLLIALAFLAASAALWWPVQAQAVDASATHQSRRTGPRALGQPDRKRFAPP